MTKLSGPPIAIAVHRDTEHLCWRARCFDPPFLLETADNRTLVTAIERAFNTAFGKDPELVGKLGLSIESSTDDRPGHYDVPYYTTKVG